MKSGVANLATGVSLVGCGLFLAYIPEGNQLASENATLTEHVVLFDRAGDWVKVGKRDDVGWLVAINTEFDSTKSDRLVRHLVNSPANVLVISSISNKALSILQQMPRLRALILMDCEVSDQGLKHLRAFPNLETVGFFNCDVTHDGVARLQDRMPVTRFEIHSSREAGFVFHVTGCLTRRFQNAYHRSTWH